MSEQEVLAMMGDAFSETSPLTPSMRRDDIDGWDSMGALMLMAELDERFGLQLDAEESRSMQVVSDLFAYLRRHGVMDE